MDKHKEHHKAKEKDLHNGRSEDAKRGPDQPGREPEKQAGSEKSPDERRKEERRAASRRECDRLAAEQCSAALEDNRKLKDDMDALKDTMLRRQADFENYKKRMAKQQAEVRTMVVRDFAHEIILVNDDLLRAIDASENMPAGSSLEDAHKSFVQGVSMISNRIEETMKKFGVVEIEALDNEFDPNFHEAMDIEMSGDVERDTVTKVYQKGFRIEDLVVRSARVKVAKPARPAAGTQAAECDGPGSAGSGGETKQ
ncbi:MAG TPA: nucleotide exchange factor GrpE [Spirochaetota bacterium]|nr:nucleotide exchange factor GrpE [Spirochaetota bacterium]HPG49521.1 nucleotide exchange factor GrpE [Spirochaetota bacterium]HPN11456.1 nucleotide exchange factor GrpE [Spirochaetota bacterium]